MYKLDLEKAEHRSNCQHPLEHRKIKGIKKKSISASLTMLKRSTVWITTNCRKFFKRWDYQITLLISWETCMQVKKQQLEMDTEQWAGLKLEKEYIKVLNCHPAHLTSMQRTSYEMLGWMNPTWNQDHQEKYQQQICR